MQITNTVQRNKQRLIWAAYVFASLFSLWIRAGFPVFGIPASPHDDALFQHLARNLLMGEWLGEYNNLTLAKGMFYPFFISASAVAGLPLKMAEHLLYLGCALLAARYFVRVTGREIAGLALFVLLAFNPFLWTEEMARVMREGIYLSLSMALLILSFALLLPSENSSSGRIGIAAKALITGIVAGFYWLTREEGMWLAPALATLFIFAFAHQWQKLGLRQTASGTLPKAIVLVMLVFCVVVGGVRYENWRHYQIFETTEFHAASFLRAYGTLVRIHQDAPRRYVVFPRDAQERAYSVSAAARELKPSLEGQNGENWRSMTCNQLIPDCSEIASGGFMWAFRDAVELSGHYKTGGEAMKFYDRLAKEINTACDEGKIQCLSPRETLAPVFHRSYLLDALFVLKPLLAILLSPGDEAIALRPSMGTQAQLVKMSDLVGQVNDGEQRIAHIGGWIASRDSVPRVELSNDEDYALTGVVYSKADDVKKALPGFDAIRFQSYLLCGKQCKIRIAKDHASAVLLNNGLLVDQPGLKMYIDELSTGAKPVETGRRKLQHAVAKAIAKLYRLVMPVLCLFGVIGIFLGLVRTFRTRQISPVVVLALASFVAVLTRIALLSYLDVTSIPSLNIRYASPATPLLIIFAVVGSFVFFDCFRSLRMSDIFRSACRAITKNKFTRKK